MNDLISRQAAIEALKGMTDRKPDIPDISKIKCEDCRYSVDNVNEERPKMRFCTIGGHALMNTVPMTPTRRMEINGAIDKNIAELRTCEPNALVNMQIAAWETHRKLINAIPDGYQLPLIDRGVPYLYESDDPQLAQKVKRKKI